MRRNGRRIIFFQILISSSSFSSFENDNWLILICILFYSMHALRFSHIFCPLWPHKTPCKTWNFYFYSLSFASYLESRSHDKHLPVDSRRVFRKLNRRLQCGLPILGWSVHKCRFFVSVVYSITPVNDSAKISETPYDSTREKSWDCNRFFVENLIKMFCEWRKRI